MDQEQETTEVVSTTDQQGDTEVRRETVSRESIVSPQTMLARVVWFTIGLITVFIAVRIILLLLAANQGNGFVDFVYGVGAFFAAPFFGIFSYEPVYGSSVFEVSSLVAIIVYLLVGWGMVKLVTLGSSRQEA